MSLPENLNQARRAASQDPARLMSFRYIRDQAMRLLGEHTPTEESLRSMHNAKLCPRHPDPVVVWALAQVYGVPLSELSRDADALVRAIAAKLTEDEMVAAGRIEPAGVAANGAPTFLLVPASPRTQKSRCGFPPVQPMLPGFDGGVWVGASPKLVAFGGGTLRELVAA